MAGGLSGLPALFIASEQTAAQLIEQKARRLVAEAEALGLHVTIERKSVPPLAMRNHVPVISVWERR